MEKIVGSKCCGSLRTHKPATYNVSFKLHTGYYSKILLHVLGYGAVSQINLSITFTVTAMDSRANMNNPNDEQPRDTKKARLEGELAHHPNGTEIPFTKNADDKLYYLWAKRDKCSTDSSPECAPRCERPCHHEYQRSSPAHRPLR